MNDKVTNNRNKTRMYHIDGIKGLMCFLIMFGHFWNIYRQTEAGSILENEGLDIIKNSFLDQTLLSATFWLYAFLVISGYLLSNTRVRSLSEIIIKTAKRFLRLFIPILGACIFIYLIQETIGFYTADTIEYFNNGYIRQFYVQDLSWKSIFIEPLRAMIKSSCRFNAPFWVITDMFKSSILIYICNFTDYVLKKKSHVLPWIFLLLSIFSDAHVMIACMAGYMVGHYKEEIDKLTENRSLFLIISAAIFVASYEVYTAKTFTKIFDNIMLYILLYCFLMIVINKSELFQKIFSKKLFLRMGKISFGVYALHWPIICSIGLKVLMWGLNQQWKFEIIYLLSFVVSCVCTVLLSVIYRSTVEKLADYIIAKFSAITATIGEKK